jgi:hypothetical protein
MGCLGAELHCGVWEFLEYDDQGRVIKRIRVNGKIKTIFITVAIELDQTKSPRKPVKKNKKNTKKEGK